MSLCLPSVSARRRIRRPALVLAVWLLGAAALAQTAAIPPIPFENSVDPQVAVRLPADTGYWVVSTHESSQSFGCKGPQFRPCVTRVDHGCGRRHACFAGLCRSLTPGVPVCIYVHGSFVSSDELDRQASMTNSWLRSASCGHSMQMINLAWPSNRPIIVPTVKLDVNILGRRAARNGWYLADLIRHIPPECPICLIGHSHGSRMIASALHLLGGGAVQGKTYPYARTNGRLIRTVFAASAMRHDWLNPGERYGRAMCATSCLINLRNKSDAALMLYPLRHPFSGHALGTTGFTDRDRRNLRGWSRRVQEYDVAQLVGFGHMWPRFLEHRCLAQLIRNYVFFPDVRPGRLVSAEESVRTASQHHRPGSSVAVGESGES